MRSVVTLLSVLLVFVFGGTGVAAAAQSGHVTMSASIDGRDITSADRNAPLLLQPGKPANITVEIQNNTNESVDIRRIVLRGQVIGLTFFAYTSSVDLPVAAASSSTITYRLDLSDLDGQATGLMKAHLAAVDSAGNQVARVDTVTDVRGSMLSVYGLFGISIVVLTVLSLVDVILAVSRHRLSANRFKRGLRMLVPGIGIGLTLAFTASVVRLWVPDTGQWLSIAGLVAAVFFGLGYLWTPPGLAEIESSSADHDPEDDDEYLGAADPESVCAGGDAS
jgi:hypothetical protein